MPIWMLLGGKARDRIKTYNTCGGPAYGRPTRGRSVYGLGGSGKDEDLTAFMTDAGELALDLLSEGIEGMKIWPLDTFVHHPGRWDDWQSLKGAFDPDFATLAVNGLTTGICTRDSSRFARFGKRSGIAWRSCSKATAFGRCLPRRRLPGHSRSTGRPGSRM